MNAAVGRNTAIPFGARSLLAFVLEPKTPLSAWLEDLDAWLARSPNFFSTKPVMLQMAGVEISLKDYRDLLSQLNRRHIRVMAVENSSRILVGPHLPPLVAGGRVVVVVAGTVVVVVVVVAGVMIGTPVDPPDDVPVDALAAGG